MLERECQRVC